MILQQDIVTNNVSWIFVCVCPGAQSCLILYDTMVCSLPGSSVHEIFQARILEWVAIPSPGDLPDPRMELLSPALADGFSTPEPPRKPNREFAFALNSAP